MAHLFEEVAGIIAAIFSAIFAVKAKQAAEGGPAMKAGEIARGVVMQRLPKMFGFGLTDERLLESLRQLVSASKRSLVDLVISQMRDYEADIFRLTVTGMSCGLEVVPDKPIGNPQKGKDPIATQKVISWEFTAKDLRVKYLEDIADEVSSRAEELGLQFAAMLVVEDMRERRLIARY